MAPQTESRSLAPLLRKAARALAEASPELAAELTAAAAAESTPIKGLPVARFLALVTPLLPTLSLPPPRLRTKAWYGRVGKMLRQSGLDEELAQELARKVAAWSNQPMPVETLITGASRYLASPDPERSSPPAGSLGPRPLWEDEGDSE